MACPGFLCRKHTVTMCMNQPLQKVDAVSIPPPPAACLPSDKYSVWMWTKHHSDKQLGVLDVHRGTFRHAEALTPGGRACATVVITEGERRRIWVSTLVRFLRVTNTAVVITLLFLLHTQYSRTMRFRCMGWTRQLNLNICGALR